VSGEALFVISLADQTNGSFRAIWTAGLTVCNWPGAAVPNVRAKQTMDKLRISAKGCFAAPAPTGRRRPQAVFSAARGNLPEPDIRAGAAEMCTEGLIPILQAAELVSPTWFT